MQTKTVEYCPECGRKMTCINTRRQRTHHYKRYECPSCNIRVSKKYPFGVHKERNDNSEIVKRIEQYIAEHQPVTRGDVIDEFGLSDREFQTYVFNLTYNCPIWESDEKPILYGIDYSIRGTIDKFVDGSVQRMSRYGEAVRVVQ